MIDRLFRERHCYTTLLGRLLVQRCHEIVDYQGSVIRGYKEEEMSSKGSV